MGTKGEAFAEQFESKVEEATALLEKLSDANWTKTTAAEKWTVAATAHHVASSYEPITQIIKTIAAGQTLPHFTRQMLDEMNAQHAKEFAGCTKPETIALHQKGLRPPPRPCVASPMPSSRRPALCSRGCPR
jgi:Mycothiol maleylpyruvate isomerase N-terminal domain